jgi:hypothetical protein
MIFQSPPQYLPTNLLRKYFTTNSGLVVGPTQKLTKFNFFPSNQPFYYLIYLNKFNLQ